MDHLLDRAAFPGPAMPSRAVVDRFMGEARFDGCIAITNWVRADVEKVLPPQLMLADNASSAPNLHPVMFMFGALRNTTILFGGVAIPTGVDYPEFLVAVPYVRHREGQYLHTFMVRMYSSVQMSVLVGNTYYGFAKSLASMRWQGAIFVVSDADDLQLLAHACVEVDRAATRQLPAQLAPLREALSLPVVGCRGDGSLISSYFDVDFAAGSVTAADAWISIDAPLVAELTPRRCYDAPSGTVQFSDVIWRLSWPFACHF